MIISKDTFELGWLSIIIIDRSVDSCNSFFTINSGIAAAPVLQRLRSPELVGSMEQGIDAIHAKFDDENPIYGGVRLNAVSIDNQGFD